MEKLEKLEENPKAVVKDVVLAHASGTGAGNSCARIISSTLGWLHMYADRKPEEALLYSKLIKYIISNTDKSSLDYAQDIIEMANDKYPGFHIDVEYELMHKDGLGGKGASTLEEGKEAIKHYLTNSNITEKIQNACLYMPITTIGSGNTGSTSALPLAEAGMQAEECWTVPLHLLSSKAEMDVEHAKHRSEIIEIFDNMPIWRISADNDSFVEDREWNNQMPMQDLYQWIDHSISHAMKTLLLMFVHTIQIDKSKLESRVFKGPGGLICIGGADINPNYSIEDEVNRSVNLLINGPIKVEGFANDSENSRKFDVIIIGTTGGISAPDADKAIQAIKSTKYVADNLYKKADLFMQRFAAYIPSYASSLFTLMIRHREGESQDTIKYPPSDHPILKQLRRLELNTDSEQKIVNMGRKTPIANPLISPKPKMDTSVMYPTAQVNQISSNITDKPISKPELFSEPITKPMNGATNGNGVVVLKELSKIPQAIATKVIEPPKTVQKVNSKTAYSNCRELLENHKDDLNDLLSKQKVVKVNIVTFDDGKLLLDAIKNLKDKNNDFRLAESWENWIIQDLGTKELAKVDSSASIEGVVYRFTDEVQALQKSLGEISKIQNKLSEKDKSIVEMLKLLILYKQIFLPRNINYLVKH